MSGNTQNLTPTDEREIAKAVSDRSLGKDVAMWKGYAEVNFENPSKVKKNLKHSKRIIAITQYKLLFFKVKKCDFDSEFSLLDCVQISVIKPGNFTLAFKKGMVDREKCRLEVYEKDKSKSDAAALKNWKYVNISTEDNRKVEKSIIKTIRESIRLCTDSWPVSRLKIEHIPPEWLLDLPDYKSGTAAGVLSSYLAVSDYRTKIPDHNFMLYVKSQVLAKSRDLVLSDCAGIDIRAWSGGKPTFDLLTISEALESNTYFESLVIQNINQKDAGEAVSYVMLRNKTLKRLVVKNCNAVFGSDFGYSLFYNKAHSLTVIDLSNNLMPGIASIPLAHSFLSLQHVIKVLCLANMDISAKGLMTLAHAFSTNWGMSLGLEELDISHNNTDTACTEAWAQWFKNVGKDAKLRRLSIAHTGMSGPLILPPLANLPLQYLDISGLKYSGKGDEDSISKFILETQTLRILRIAESSLAAPSVSKILTAVPGNTNILAFHLDLSKNLLSEKAGTTIASVSFSNLKSLTSLNLASIGLKAKGLLPIIQALPTSIQTLICDENFEASDSEKLELGLAIGKLLEVHTSLTHLSLAATQSANFGAFLTPVFKALKVNDTLLHLNISNQFCGDTVFSQLCRSLHTNSKLDGLKFAGNNLSYNGYLAFEQALENNTTLKYIEFFDDLPYEKLCLGTNKFANDLLSSLHNNCILRRAGAKASFKDLFAFDSVTWETPAAMTPLPAVPSRLANIKANTDWNQLEAEVAAAQPQPAPADDQPAEVEQPSSPRKKTPKKPKKDGP